MVPDKSSSGQKLSTDSFPSNGFGGLTFYESIMINMVYKNMKICIIAASMHIMGGHAVQASSLKERLEAEGILIDFMPINPLLPGFLNKLQQIKYVRTLISWPLYIIHLFCLVHRYDVLHLFSASYLSFLLAPAPAAIIGKIFGKRIILNYHSGEAEDHLLRSLKIIKFVLGYVDSIVVPSRYLQKVFSSFNIDSTVIYNVVEMDAFPYCDRKHYSPRFLVSRNLEPIYNIECVIKCFCIIQYKFPDASLTILGTGSQERELKSLVVKLNLSNVHFAGRVERADIAKYFSGNDIMLNASNIDNMPLSILEAFSAGLPVVSTKSGGIPYMIKHRITGLLVPLNDHESLARCAIELLENKELAAGIAHGAHEECLRKYSWDVVRDQWLMIYGGKC